MNERRPEPHEWTDERIESLLVDFFAEEMPPALRATRRATVASVTTRPAPEVARVPEPRSSRLVLGVATLAVLVVAVATLFRPTEPSSTDDGAIAADGDPARVPVATTVDEVVVERVEERVEPLAFETFDTTNGPVELRAVRETTNVSVFDEETGRAVDLESQVLDIEIIPIDDEDDTGFNTELPMADPDRPRLPEEG